MWLLPKTPGRCQQFLSQITPPKPLATVHSHELLVLVEVRLQLISEFELVFIVGSSFF